MCTKQQLDVRFFLEGNVAVATFSQSKVYTCTFKHSRVTFQYLKGYCVKHIQQTLLIFGIELFSIKYNDVYLSVTIRICYVSTLKHLLQEEVLL